MKIERTKDEIIIRVSSDTNINGLENMIKYLKYKEVISKSKATEKDIDQLVKEIKSTRKSYWKENKERILGNNK